jgi:multidrug efflux system membrane fusion protein
LLSGENISGKISYIASRADPNSSTFRIEAEFPNPDFKILSGISAKFSIPLYPVEAIYVSPSVLAMDEQGNLGVKLVEKGTVIFKRINLVEADNDGAWLSGFTAPVDIITLGQGFVKAGDRVQAIAAEKY